MKKGIIQFIQHLAASIFVGIAAYGAIIYWGAETRKRIPIKQSLIMGLGAVICIIVVVAVGGLQDRIAASEERESGSEREDHD